jgi:hypothetical protein
MTGATIPLSDSITRLVGRNTPEHYADFIRVFMDSRLGIIVQGVPAGAKGEFTAGQNQVSAALGMTPDGKKMLLACAGRAVFVQRFNRPFNAEIDAPSLLTMALANPSCEGVMINSAASEHTVTILRAQIPELMPTAEFK